MNIALFLMMILSKFLFAQECSHLWNKNLEINPVGPKAYVGDSYAAYGLMGYKNKPGLAWHFVGEFPRGRFMSIETYTTAKKRQYDFHFDFQINPSVGSENPFRVGTLMETPRRSFEVDLIPAEGHSANPNVIFISPTEPVHAIYYRIYVPSQGVLITEKDLPKVYAYDIQTGKEMECPEADLDVIFAPDLPQLMVEWVTPKKVFKFKSAKNSIFSKLSNQGNNAAIPDYQFALNRVKKGKVVLIRFKSPTFFDTGTGQGPFQSSGDVRYWSLCTQNLVKGQTLNCVPDYLATPDNNGFVTVAIGIGDKVKNESLKRGFAFLEDKREEEQHIMQFIYRNLYPRAEFQETEMYLGDYSPNGKVCSEKEFLNGDCQ